MSAALVEACGPSAANAVCITNYSAVLPASFYRAPIENAYFPSDQPSFAETTGVNRTDPSFDLLGSASFIVWNKELGIPLLTDNATNEFVVTIGEYFTDAPIFVPITNEFYFSSLDPGIYSQQVLNLTDGTLTNKTANPPIYSAEGGVFYKGLIYYGTGGSSIPPDASSANQSQSDHFHTGVYTLDPLTSVSTPILNNVFGWALNSIDDLTVDPILGDIWFTENSYGKGNGVNPNAPVLPMQTYHFRPSTGELRVVEDSLGQPNGIGFSPDGRICYISDTGAITANYLANDTGYKNYNVTSPHTLYAFDVQAWTDADGPYLINKRPIYFSQQWLPDGLRVTREGYLLIGTGSGVDVLTAGGRLVMSIPTNFTAVNSNFAGSNLDELYIVGVGGIGRVKGIDLHGQEMFAG